MIIYDEPAPGLDEAGNEVTCNRQVSVTNEDAIKIQRYTLAQLFTKRGSKEIVTNVPPDVLVEDYIVVHWAREEGGEPL